MKNVLETETKKILQNSGIRLVIKTAETQIFYVTLRSVAII